MSALGRVGIVFTIVMGLLIAEFAVVEADPVPTVSSKISSELLEKLRTGKPTDTYMVWVGFVDRPEHDDNPEDGLPPVDARYVGHVGSTPSVKLRFVDELSNELSVEAPAKAIYHIESAAFVTWIEEVPVGRVGSHSHGSLAVPVNSMDLENLHHQGFDGTGIRVAILDTGVRITHEAMASKQASLLWRDFVNNQPSPYDDHGHGTSVAALAVGNAPSRPYRGSAHDAPLMALKVCNSIGNCPEDGAVEAIQFAVQNGARVVSMSFGYGLAFGGYCTSEANILKDGRSRISRNVGWAVSQGVHAVVLAGNEHGSTFCGGSEIRRGGDNHNAITVGATTADGSAIASFSSWGPTADGRLKPDVVAPGQSISVACVSSDTCYTTTSGTSLATPLVAGALASILEKRSSWSPATLKAAVRQTAAERGAVGPDNTYGFGLVQTGRASDAAVDMGLSWDDAFRVNVGFAAFTVSDFGTNLRIRDMTFHGKTGAFVVDIPWVYTGSGWVRLDNSILYAGPFISGASATDVTLSTVYFNGCTRMTLMAQLIERSATRVELTLAVSYSVCDQFSLVINARSFFDFDVQDAARDYFERMSDGFRYTTETKIQGTSLRVRDTAVGMNVEIFYNTADNSPNEWLLAYPGNRDCPDCALTGQSINGVNVVFEYESRRGSSRAGQIGPTVYVNT